jgi:cytosine deaminase
MSQHVVLRNAAVPRALVADAAGFGGTLRDDCLVGDLHLVAGQVAGMQPRPVPPGAEERFLRGQIVLPRLAEVHCHLDKCHTVARLAQVGGDLQAAIAAQHADKARWSQPDILRRATRGLAELQRAGVALARSHVDWEPDDVAQRRVPAAWTVLERLAREWAGRITLQRVALLPLEAFGDADAARWVVRQVAASEGGVLGAFIFDQPQRRELVRRAFELATEMGVMLDFHVDEGLDPALDGLTTVCELALDWDNGRQVVCGHACRLAALDGAAAERALDLVRDAGVAIVALPTTNLYLQGRGAGTPQQRGITRLRELAARGVPLAVGSDNVCDAFCPIGAHDPLAALATAALAAHLDPPYDRWLRLVTTDARRILGAAPLHVDRAAAGDLLLAEAMHTAEVVAGAPRRPLEERRRPAAG